MLAELMLDANSFDFCVKLQRVFETFSAYSRHFGSSKWHVHISNQPAVNPHSPHLKGEHVALSSLLLWMLTLLDHNCN